MTILKPKELIIILQLTFFIIVVLSAMAIFYINQFLNLQFQFSMITLDSLLPSKN